MPYIEPEDYRPEAPLRTQVTGPIAWEDPSLPWRRRLMRTLGATFAPIRSLPAVASGELAPAFTFACLTALPFMLVWAIVPFTHTLIFKPEFGLEVVTKPGGLSVPLDVSRAVAIGLAQSVISVLSWSLPFASLLKAFAAAAPHNEEPKRAAWRTTLYRVWVVPFGMAAFSFLLWALPKDPSPFVVEVSLLSFQALPRLLILIHCHAMGRYFGATGLGALSISALPLVVEWAVGLTVQRGAALLLPPMPMLDG